MKDNVIKTIMRSTGPMLSLTLIGILVLSALLYYRAVKIQRFLEPALAITEPRIKFNQEINNLLIKEFGTTAKGITFRRGSIFVDQSLLFAIPHHKERSKPLMLNKLSRVFLSALSNPDISSHISLILISINLPITADPNLNKELRFEVQKMTAYILNALYATEPVLEKQYGKYFAVAAISVDAPVKEPNLIEFRMIPSERLHIQALERLEQYFY
ncbi:MAG: hypothetical protein HZB30_02355 [Nitrospirae bacterium]|nr:hypothetical protein [Nitrospirota bacterium]